MLAVGVGETITDGVSVYVLDRDLSYRKVKGDPKRANHRVSTEVLKVLVSA